jgi:hypothetical protein
MLFKLPLDTKSSVASFLGVIRQPFWMSSSARCSNARVSAVVGLREQGTSLSSAWHFLEPAIHEAQQLTLLLSTTLYLYKFVYHL